MSLKNKSKKDVFSTKFATAYSFGQLADVIAYQLFVFLIFTFYYAVVGLNINLITLGFIIWSVWNAINDPLIGALSDRTHTRWGRRTPYILIGIVPLCIVTILLWTPPTNSEIATFIYFVVIILIFDTVYTTFSMGQSTLFPEIFTNLEERTKANNIRQIFTVIGLIIAFIMPTFFIPKLDSPKYFINYRYVGIFAAILIGIFATIFIKFGLKEPVKFSEDYKTAPSFFKSLNISLKNKSFRWYVIAHFATWYVYGMLPTIIPLYATFVLGVGEGESILIGLLLGVTFISATIFMFFWRFVVLKVGVKKAIMISMTVFIITLIPLMFITTIFQAFIVFFLIGIGLSGSFLYLDILIASVMDEDELLTGTRRTGGYYGISTFILRFSTIFMFLTISIVFNSVGWAVFDPKRADADTIMGLRILMCVFPAIALGVGILALTRFPINKNRYLEIQQELEKLHKEKSERFS